MQTTRRLSIRATVLGLTVAAVLGACTGAEPEPTDTPSQSPTTSPTATPSESPTPTETEDPAEVAAKAEILDAYRTYWDVAAVTLADPNAPLPEGFDHVLVDKARAAIGESVLWAQENRVVMVGAPVIDPEVDELVLGPEASAHIVDCVDSSDWILTLASTGDPASTNRPETSRVTADGWAIIFDGRWVIREVTLNRDDPC